MRVIDPQRLAAARKRKGYSQRNLAALSRCTQAAISALETGAMTSCSEGLAQIICKWLDRDVEDLFERHSAVLAPTVNGGSRSTGQPRSARRRSRAAA